MAKGQHTSYFLPASPRPFPSVAAVPVAVREWCSLSAQAVDVGRSFAASCIACAQPWQEDPHNGWWTADAGSVFKDHTQNRLTLKGITALPSSHASSHHYQGRPARYQHCSTSPSLSPSARRHENKLITKLKDTGGRGWKISMTSKTGHYHCLRNYQNWIFFQN